MKNILLIGACLLLAAIGVKVDTIYKMNRGYYLCVKQHELKDPMAHLSPECVNFREGLE